MILAMSSASPVIDATVRPRTRRWPATFWIGLGAIVALEVLLFSDVALSGRHAASTEAALVAGAALAAAHRLRPARPLGGGEHDAARLAGVRGHARGGARRADRHQPGPPAAAPLRAAVPGVGRDLVRVRRDQLLQPRLLALHPRRPRRRGVGPVLGADDLVRDDRPRDADERAGLPELRLVRLGPQPPLADAALGEVAALGAGAAMVGWVFLSRSPAANLTLWTSLVFLLDPVNLKLGRPSMFRDWQNGWYGRTLAAFAGGLLCGLLWEFWNYWALIKWVYHLPFLGPLEHVKYFEMPAIGLIGFIPFGLECWVMWQAMRIPLDGLAEPLPDERMLL